MVKSMRTVAREVAFKLIFASRFAEEFSPSLKAALYKTEKLKDDDISYSDRIIALVREHGAEFTEIIDGRSYAFPEARIFPADKSILFLALAEIKYMDDVPDIVSVNEAANMASKYSSEKSASFISGILSEIIKEKACSNYLTGSLSPRKCGRT